MEELEEFKKFDTGKTMMSLVTPSYIIGTAKVLTLGAAKYDKNNWKLNKDKSRYEDSLLRHTYSYLAGEKLDPESGLSHLYHISCNLMFLEYLDETTTSSNN